MAATFDLRTERAPERLAPLGGVVELRELPYGQMRAAMASGEPGQSTDRLFAASLHVDGAPFGYEALQALPGRFAGGIADAMSACLRLHGLITEPADESAGPKA
jgi:hypothetical protein